MRLARRGLPVEPRYRGRFAAHDVEDLALVLVDLDRAIAEEVGGGADITARRLDALLDAAKIGATGHDRLVQRCRQAPS
jgi:hypothetical protein